jgi:hypothetical protein
VTRNAGINAGPSHATEAGGGPSVGFAKTPKAPQAIQTTPSTKQIHCSITAVLEDVRSFVLSVVVLSAFCFAFRGCLLSMDPKYVNIRPVCPEAIVPPLHPKTFPLLIQYAFKYILSLR